MRKATDISLDLRRQKDAILQILPILPHLLDSKLVELLGSMDVKVDYRSIGAMFTRLAELEDEKLAWPK